MLVSDEFMVKAYERAEMIMRMGPYGTVDNAGVRSLAKGQCFTMTFNDKVKAKNMNLSMVLTKGFEYDLYLNPTGQI